MEGRERLVKKAERGPDDDRVSMAANEIFRGEERERG
jgi:hypothetical protein